MRRWLTAVLFGAACAECEDLRCPKCEPTLAGPACNKTSPACLKGCCPGFWGMPLCQNACDFEQHKCNVDDHTPACDDHTGKCKWGCRKGYWNEPECDAECDFETHHCDLGDHPRMCDGKSGMCIWDCAPGYWGSPSCEFECAFEHHHCNLDDHGPRCDSKTGGCLWGCQKGYWGSHCNLRASLGKRLNQACRFGVETAVKGAAGVPLLCSTIFEDTIKGCLAATVPLDEIPVAPEVFCAVLGTTTWLTCDHYGGKALLASGLDKIKDSTCSTQTWYPDWAGNVPPRQEIVNSELLLPSPPPAPWPAAFTASAKVVEHTSGASYSYTLQFSASQRTESYSRSRAPATLTGYRQACAGSDSIDVIAFNATAAGQLQGCTSSVMAFENCAVAENYLSTKLLRYQVTPETLRFNGTRGTDNVWIGLTPAKGVVAYLADASSGRPSRFEVYDVHDKGTLLMSDEFTSFSPGEPAFAPIDAKSCADANPPGEVPNIV